MKWWLVLSVVFGCAWKVRSNDVLGCGGFIKSHVPIDFSKVEVVLYTKQGILKDRTNAAPYNGYYFIPLYDKGTYSLHVSPPPGWTFKPLKVSVVIGGISTDCTTGHDIDFTFQGFGITGKVVSYGGQGRGPANLDVELKSEGGESRRTTTYKAGLFLFTPVYPGNYTITVSHPKWKLLKDSVKISLTEGNAELPSESLVVSGYDVSGVVTSKGEPVEDVTILLYGKKDVNAIVEGCDKTPLLGSNIADLQYYCSVKSNKQGVFTFPVVSLGTYRLHPYYNGLSVHFRPESIEFKVEHNSLQLADNFEIIGFSVTGRVLIAENGSPVSGAKVFLNGKETTITNSKGVYILEKLDSQSCTIQIIADELEFKERLFTIAPNTLNLPELTPSAYRVCGNVVSNAEHTVVVTSESTGDQVFVTSHPPAGVFCYFLPPGKYDMRIVTDKNAANKDLVFLPESFPVIVKSSPLSGFTFSQLKATIAGNVQCIRNADCASLQVVLRTEAHNDITIDLIGGAFSLKDVRPGTYEVFLTPNRFCWKDNRYPLTISSTMVTVPTFVQTGYSVIFSSSHDTKASYNTPTKQLKEIEIPKGESSHCLKSPGSYSFELNSCHVYDSYSVPYNTNSSNNELVLVSKRHKTKLGIVSKIKVEDLSVELDLAGNKRVETSLPWQNGLYYLDVVLSPDETVGIIPHSSIFYFIPKSLNVTGSDDCSLVEGAFIAVEGKVFRGKIVPALSGVIVSVSVKNSEILTHETDESGKYTFPPLDQTVAYEVTAQKERYVFVGPDLEGNFKAHKLAEVTVEVVDYSDQTPLQGALLSLSGGQSFRSNLQTNKDGVICFHSLSPNDYYLRPVMKEYEFTPNSQIINVAEGAAVNLKLRGKRVAFSAFGQVTSLNGEPEEQMVVYARGIGNCSEYSEETTSEQNGNFRIRGLRPYCSYDIKVKSGNVETVVIERTNPRSLIKFVGAEDVTGLKFTVFRKMVDTDVLLSVHANNADFYKLLRVKIVRESPPSALILKTRLDDAGTKVSHEINPGTLMFLPAIPLDDKLYSIHLESLSGGNVENKINVNYLMANTTFKNVEFEYKVLQGPAEQLIKQTSVWTLMAVLVTVVLCYNVKRVVELIKFQLQPNAVDTYFGVFKAKSANGEFGTGKTDEDQIPQGPVGVKRKLKPRKI